MIHSFKDTLDQIADRPHSLEWKTNRGQSIHGVLYVKDGQLHLNVNSKMIEKSVEFDYLYHENEIDGRRVLYPFDGRGYNRIHAAPVTGSTPVPIYMIVDEQSLPEAFMKDSERITFVYDSFVRTDVPQTKKEQNALYKLLKSAYDLETSIGKISIDFPIMNGASRHPAQFSKTMDKLTVSITPDKPFTNREILMWNDRIRQFLAFIHKERVVTSSIYKIDATFTIPHLNEDYEEESYAWRESIFLEEFLAIVAQIIPSFVDHYNKIEDVLDNLTQYYYDYPLDPPDNVQLLRLFTALEQCADLAQRQEKLLGKALANEEMARKAEFKKLLKHLKNDADQFPTSYAYLQETTQSYFVSDGSKTKPAYKIQAMAELLQKEYEVYVELRDESKVSMVLSMRNMLAHGQFKPAVHAEFYKHRDDLGQDVEQCLRMYILRTLGCSRELIIRQKEPLKARRFNTL